ncbi:MBOAT family protein [Cytobacillus firmus]|uniref:MBOAT family O-acyltransferase n=1 Tax=Cytobacillus firmus TaxID=1399 RepID=UPI00384F1990
MVFSNLVFLFAFLPIVLLTYFIAPRQLKNTILLIASLIFYAWGEPTYIFLMLISILLNYLFGLAINSSKTKSHKKVLLSLSIIGNLAILGYYKYANFFVENINQIFKLNIEIEPIPLPIGISFFTFQAMSYVIDVYRKDASVQKNLFDLALYIALFPQLVAGPIVRYRTVAEQIRHRVIGIDRMADGIRRFVLGLSKKVLIANPLGALADDIFAMSAGDLTTGTAWLGILAYTLQIYFDFSGYSDMAIGLGKMFGFEFDENFRYPYIARSISEFWRRWHISLSSWFRDYIYFPLGGSRGPRWMVYRNLLIVWTITGFWHGASWTFMMWGFYYGVIISLEKAGLEKVVNSLWKPFQHFYVLLIVMIGWVFFRADNFAYSFEYIKAMFGSANALYDHQTLLFIADNGHIFLLGILFSMPVYPVIREKLAYAGSRFKLFQIGKSLLGSGVYIALLVLVTMYLVNSSYNPFIYFRF